MNEVLDRLDAHYASKLGCKPQDLNSGKIVVVASERREIRFAKGYPLVLFSLAKPPGAVISARPALAQAVNATIERIRPASLDDSTCELIEEATSWLIREPEWFRGQRLYCTPDGFTPRRVGEVRTVTHEDEHARSLHAKWGGEVFGQVVSGVVVAWAGVKPLSDIAWDLTVETLEGHRGKGYAKSAVSAAVEYIFANGKVATWGTDRTNLASLRTAGAVGFQDYALDFGCIERRPV